MEHKTQKMLTREAVEFVESNFKPGMTMKHIGSGDRYAMGTKHGRSDFWMMSLADSKKGLVPATTIKTVFQKVV